MSYYDSYKVDVPEGKSGAWEVKRFEISEKESEMASLRAMCNGSRGHVAPGSYTRLTRNGNVIMSDTRDEIRDHMGCIRVARGEVLIHGLGIGMVLQAVAHKDEVTHVTVIERSDDVIKLVWPHYQQRFDDKVSLIQADTMEWKPPKGKRWDVVWFDIWDYMCVDNLNEMATLHRRYGRRATWKGSWGREYILRQRQKSTRHYGWR